MGIRHLTLLLCAILTLQIACGDDTEPTEPEPTCGDGMVDDGEACDDGNDDDGDACRNNCTIPACGDGILDNNEACDDGNDVDDDACRADCVLPACGDAVMDPLEECDEGEANSEEPDATCRTNCRAPRCGDGVVDAGEVCDDGNTARGDGCTPDCLSNETCGNGVLDLTEQCDDGNLLSNDGCASDCVVETPRWTLFTPETVSTGLGYVQVFDANRGQLLRFNEEGTYLLDSRGWRLVTTESPLSSFVNATCVNDVGRVNVVCHAFTGLSSGGGTFVWNGYEWKTMTQDAPPPPRAPGAFVYDPARERVIMYGGSTGNPTFEGVVLFQDTWEWDGDVWTQVQTPTTPEGYAGSAAYDPVNNVVLLHSTVAEQGASQSTYSFDGADWALVSDTVPEIGTIRWERTTQEIVLQPNDTINGMMYAFNGSGWEATTAAPRNPRDEYWNGTDWVTTTPATNPPTHSLMRYWSAAYNAISGQIVLAGGSASSSSPVPLNVVPDGDLTRLYGPTGWTYGPRGPVEMHPGLAYNPANNTMMLVGAATYEWDGTDWLTSANTGEPSDYSAVAWDPNLEAMVTFGGMSGVFVYLQPGDPPPPFMASGMKVWDGTAWTEVTTTEAPGDRWLTHLLWDPVNQSVFMTGGVGTTRGSCCGVHQEAWRFDGSQWTAEQVSTRQRLWNEMVYDPHRASLIEYGGFVESRWYSQMFEKRGDDFEQLNVDGPTVPFPAMAFHALHRRTTLFDEYDVWEFGYGPVREMCTTGLDGDGDGLAGCDDPDCWGYCNPECPPGASCPTDADRCGDNVCNTSLETSRICPQDCGAPDAICGDFICDDGESAATCPGDCQ